jgi:hypothetical protein
MSASEQPFGSDDVSASRARKAILDSICLIDSGEGVILGQRAAADLFENSVLRPRRNGLDPMTFRDFHRPVPVAG